MSIPAGSQGPKAQQPAKLDLACRIEEDITDQDATPVRKLESDKSGRISRVQFTDLNKTLLTASEDGYLRRWDVEV